jgi:hypothetical protein
VRRWTRSASGCRALLLVTLIGLMAGCSPSSPEEIPEGAATTQRTTSSTTSQPTPGPTTAADPDLEVAEAYSAFWEARLGANRPPDPASPALRMTATGAQLDHVIAETQSNLEKGLEFRPGSSPPRRHITVAERSGDSATVQECVVDDTQVVRTETGETVDDKVATHSVEAILARVDGRWKVAAVHLVQRWEGVAGCAIAFGL